MIDFNKLYTDKSMRKKLLENPSEVLKKANVETMEGIEFKVVINTKDTVYFVVLANDYLSSDLNKLQAGVKVSTAGTVGSAGTASTASSLGTLSTGGSCLGTEGSIGSIGSLGTSSTIGTVKG